MKKEEIVLFAFSIYFVFLCVVREFDKTFFPIFFELQNQIQSEKELKFSVSLILNPTFFAFPFDCAYIFARISANRNLFLVHFDQSGNKLQKK